MKAGIRAAIDAARAGLAERQAKRDARRLAANDMQRVYSKTAVPSAMPRYRRTPVEGGEG
jgi:hypothetical protein